MGRAAARDRSIGGWSTPRWRSSRRWWRPRGRLRRTRGEAAGEELGPPSSPVDGERGNPSRIARPAGRPGRWWAGAWSAKGLGRGRSPRSSQGSGKPATRRRGAASSQWWDWHVRRSPVIPPLTRPKRTRVRSVVASYLIHMRQGWSNGMPDPEARELSIGQRVALHRKRLGLTQDGLALRLHRSKSWVTKIERGERPLGSVRALLELARALGVEVRELTGHPWFPEPGGPGHEAVPAIRRGLLALAPPVAESRGGERAEPRELPVLEADVLDTGRLWQTEPNPFSVVVPLLPDLVAETRLAVEAATAADRRRAWRVAA